MTPAELAELFVANVHRLLEMRQLSQRELGAILGKPESNVSSTLSKKTPPSGTTLAAYATALDVDVCELLCAPKKKAK